MVRGNIFLYSKKAEKDGRENKAEQNTLEKFALSCININRLLDNYGRLKRLQRGDPQNI